MLHVCDIVEYGRNSFNTAPQTWRVTHHLKRVEDPVDTLPASTFAMECIKKIGLDNREKEREQRKKAGLPHSRRYRLEYCRPKEATHVELVSVCGTHASISECKKIGIVNWNKTDIRKARLEARDPRWLKQKGFTIWEWE